MPSEELPISQILHKSKSIEIKDQKLRFNTYPPINPSTSKHVQTKSINHLPWRNNSSNSTIKSNHRKTKSLDNYIIDCDKLLNELPSPPIRPKYQLIQQKLATISIEDMKSNSISTTLPTIHSKSSCHLRSQSYDIYESNDKKRRDITLDTFENDYYFNNDYGKLPKINNNYQQHNKSLSIDSHPKLLLNQFIDNMIVPPPPMMEEEGEEREEEFRVPSRKDTFGSGMTLVEEEEDEILDENMEVLKNNQRWEINERFVVKPCKRLK